MASPARAARRAITAAIDRTVRGDPAGLAAYRRGPGDPGLFGPDSVTWAVHADLPAMLIGGVAALMLQSLHPLAMAGVAQHSNFRADPFGRLRRTAAFIAGTTFGATRLVDEQIARVQRVHASVRGVAPDGRAYSADDPDLLTFVHACEARCFLAAHLRYAPRALSVAEQDRYLAEYARVAERLGARAVPDSLDAQRAYFARIEPELAATPEALDAVAFLRRPPAGVPGGVAIGQRLVVAAAAELLPASARTALGVDASAPRRVAARAGGHRLAALVRWAIGPSAVRALAAERARRPH